MMQRPFSLAVVCCLAVGSAATAFAQSARVQASTEIPAPAPLTGKLLMSDAERKQVERARRMPQTPAPVSNSADAQEQSADDTSSEVERKPRRAVTNGMLKRPDGSIVVWINGQRRDVTANQRSGTVTPSMIGVPSDIVLKPSRGETAEKK